MSKPESRCTYRQCGKTASDPVHVQENERMRPGAHVWRYEPGKHGTRGITIAMREYNTAYQAGYRAGKRAALDAVR